MRKLIVLLALLVIAPATSSAQGTTSRVAGTVTDRSGSVVPGATVTLANEATGVLFSTVTTETGQYGFEAVQVGTYTVRVELQGFKRFSSTGNPVRIGEPTTLNATLDPGGIAETVEVRASAQVVQTNTSGNLGSTFDQRTIESLPILGGRGRNPLDLVLTQPGVVAGANTGGGVHVNGARDRSWNFTLDGIDTNETSAGGSNFSPLRTNPDALAEFKVLTGNQTAEFGRNSGGQVAMVTRSGGNKFTGTAYYFDRRPEYNANEWENNIAGLPKREFTQYMPGFSVGGPIVRNKTFFFVNNQWLRANQTSRRTRTVYTQSARDGIWRYSLTGRNQPAGSSAPSIDANGNPVVPIGTYNIVSNDPQRFGLDPTIRGLIAETPLPNDFTVGDGLNTAGFTWSAPEEERQMDFVGKVDHTFNTNNSAFVRFSKGNQDTNCDQVNGGEPVFPGTPCQVNTKRSPYNWAASYRWSPTGSVVNELVVGQNHFTFDFLNPSADPSRPTFSTPVAALADFAVGNLRTVDTIQIVDNLSWNRRAHSFRFGTNMRFQKHTDVRGSVGGVNVAPIVNFSTGVNTVDPATFGIPSNINTQFDRPALQTHINFLLGRVGSISQGFVQQGSSYAPGGTPFNFEASYPEIDFYAQDTWKARSNLTVDLGLRYEAKLSPRNPDDLIRRPNQRVAVGEAPSSTLRWEQGKLWDDDWNNFAPSVGVAWDPNDDGQSVLRGNYRVAYDRLNTFVVSSSIFQSIPGITTSVVNTSFGQAGGRLRDGIPSLQPTVSPEDFLQPPPVGSGSIRVMDPNLQTPITHAWAISYQRALFKNSLFEIAYVGRRADHLFGAYDVNQAEIFDNGFLEAFKTVQAGGESALLNQLVAPDTRRLATETGSQMIRRLFSSTLDLNGVASLADGIASRVQGGRTLPELSGLGAHFFFPYPQFLDGVSVIDSEDYSRYHALEMKLERRFADGYSYLFGYTLSRSKDTRSFDPTFTVVSGGANQSASSTPFDIHNRDLNYALSDFDRTHVVSAQGVWELPFGQGRRFAFNVSRPVDVLISGWTLAGQMVGQSGRPFTVYGGSNTLSNIVQTPANCDGCSSSFGNVHEENGIVWYLTPEERARFSTPAAGELGNTGRNAFRLAGSYFINLSLAKRTRIVGQQILEFRADATNVTNHPNWGGLLNSSVVTSSLFGRNRTPIGNNSRKVMLGVKYYF
ncbi:MAG: TonB-dependent receptor [Acidobacteriota bacterium]|nr:TonB-dependent receptor [Acidobacteriota bacterium]